MGKPKKKTAGRCVFCNSGGMTKEHVWSDWLSNIIPNTEDHGQVTFRSERTADKKQIAHEPLFRKRQGSMNQRKIRNVCKTCNGGWMSRIVESATPSAKSLILDQSATIDGPIQKHLIGWIAITAIMAEFTDHKSLVIPREDRGFLMKTSVPPSDWTIMLGRYSGTERRPIHYQHCGMSYLNEDSPWPTTNDGALPEYFQLTTFVLGAFLVHTFTSTDYRTVDAARSFINHQALVRIWPPVVDRIDWPATPALNDAQVHDIATGFYRSFGGKHSIV
jgi:hypothetical protein